MWPIDVVVLDKVVEAGLLHEEVLGGWLGGFLFLSQVHAFVAPILLGMPWFDAFDVDAEPQPPDREP